MTKTTQLRLFLTNSRYLISIRKVNLREHNTNPNILFYLYVSLVIHLYQLLPHKL